MFTRQRPLHSRSLACPRHQHGSGIPRNITILSHFCPHSTHPQPGKKSKTYLFHHLQLSNNRDSKSCTDITKSFYQWMNADIGPDYAYYYSIETFDTIPTDWSTVLSTFYHYTVTQNPYSPTLSVPTELFAINTLWSTCMQGIAGFFDPPYALSTGNGLVAFATATAGDPVTDSPAKTSEAAAGPTIAPVTPSPTKTAAPVDSANSVSNDSPEQTPTSTAKDHATNSDPPAQTPNNDPPANSPSPASNDPPADPPAPSATSQDLPLAIVKIGGSKITANSASAFVIASQTLTPGGQITRLGTVLSLDPSGSALVI